MLNWITDGAYLAHISRQTGAMSIFRKTRESKNARPAPQLPALAPETEIIVVGEERYQGIERVREGEVAGVTVRPDPRNKYDKNAVAVHVDGVLAGYLSAARAKRYRPMITTTMAVDAHARPAEPSLALFVMLPRVPR
ncbi:MAG: hypothetical protein JWP31_1656 [Aeromicrobium sp.]|nr:hypothetical protein [Aeromicrobium sp.]